MISCVIVSSVIVSTEFFRSELWVMIDDDNVDDVDHPLKEVPPSFSTISNNSKRQASHADNMWNLRLANDDLISMWGLDDGVMMLNGNNHSDHSNQTIVYMSTFGFCISPKKFQLSAFERISKLYFVSDFVENSLSFTFLFWVPSPWESPGVP